MPAGVVYVGRPSKFGNPYTTVEEFQDMMNVDQFDRFTVEDVRTELRGKDLACWCPLTMKGKPFLCHADVLLEVANG